MSADKTQDAAAESLFASLTPYEQRAVEEMRLWRKAEPDFLSRFLNWSGGLVTSALNQIAPDVTKDVAKRVLDWGLNAVNDGVKWTFKEEGILQRVSNTAKMGDQPITHEEAGDVPLAVSDNVAKGYLDENHLITTLEGFGTGLGGLTLMLADIPLVFGANFRVLQQMGTCYGIRMQNRDEFPFMLSVLNYSAMDLNDKLGAHHLVRTAIRMVETPGGMKAASQTMSAGVQALAKGVAASQGVKLGKLESPFAMRFVEEVAERLGVALAKRGMTKLLPVVGGALSAGFNYWFMRENAGNAMQFFRRRYLERKYGWDCVSQLLSDPPVPEIVGDGEVIDVDVLER